MCVGITDKLFEQRYAQHFVQFRDENIKHAAHLSKVMWTLEESRIGKSLSTIKWKKHC